MAPNRGIDAEFLNLARQELADAALSAAIAAGASRADLRIHRIRDGRLVPAMARHC